MENVGPEAGVLMVLDVCAGAVSGGVNTVVCSTCCRAEAASIGEWVLEDITLVSSLIPAKDTLITVFFTPCPMSGGKIIICLLTPVMGTHQAHGEIGNIQCSLDAEDVNTTVTVLNSPTKRASTKDTDHASHALNRLVFHWVEGDKVLAIFAHAFGCMVVDSYEEEVWIEAACLGLVAQVGVIIRFGRFGEITRTCTCLYALDGYFVDASLDAAYVVTESIISRLVSYQHGFRIVRAEEDLLSPKASRKRQTRNKMLPNKIDSGLVRNSEKAQNARTNWAILRSDSKMVWSSHSSCCSSSWMSVSIATGALAIWVPWLDPSHCWAWNYWRWWQDSVSSKSG